MLPQYINHISAYILVNNADTLTLCLLYHTADSVKERCIQIHPYSGPDAVLSGSD